MTRSGHYDVIVVGVGAMGSATCAALAARGARVLGLEQYDIPHSHGSSHGETRIIRLAYYEHPSYVQLLRRSYELWDELQAWFDEPLIIRTGSLDIGPEDGWVFKGSLQSCLDNDLEHEVLSSSEMSRRYPGYQLDPDALSLFQPDGGFLRPERSIVAQVQRAHAHGGVIHAREPMTHWTSDENGVTVTTTRGTYHAERLVLCTGAWIAQHSGILTDLSVPERQVLGWFQPQKPDLFTPDRFPVFNLENEHGRWYGFPSYGIPGFKIGRYRHRGETGTPESFDWEPAPGDEKLLLDEVQRTFPKAAGPVMSLRVCMFTNTPDGHFIIDRTPDHPRACSPPPAAGTASSSHPSSEKRWRNWPSRTARDTTSACSGSVASRGRLPSLGRTAEKRIRAERGLNLGVQAVARRRQDQLHTLDVGVIGAQMALRTLKNGT